MTYTLTRGTIYLKNIHLRARHGVLPQEHVVGNDYVLNVEVDYPLSAACQSDNVADTLNYAEVLSLVRDAMNVSSALLEHVAYRICEAVLDHYSKATAVRVDLMKVAPPMTVDGDGAGVILEVVR